MNVNVEIVLTVISYICVSICMYVYVHTVNSQEVMYNSLFRDEDVQSWNDTSVVLDKFLDKVRSYVCKYVCTFMYGR